MRVVAALVLSLAVSSRAEPIAMTRIFSSNDWRRVGSGSELQFIATTAEIDRWLSDGLPLKYAPYILLSVNEVRATKRTTQGDLPLTECPSVSLASCQTSDATLFWLMSEAISGKIAPDRLDHLTCAASGFILLHHGWQTKGQLQASRIAVASKIANVTTGETVEHGEYKAVFSALARRARKDLPYATQFKDAPHLPEGVTGVRMSEGVRQEILAGQNRYVYLPGRRLE